MSQRVRAGADRIHAARRRFPWGWAALALLLLAAAALWWAWRTPGALPEPVRRSLEQGAQQARQWVQQLRDDERPAEPAQPSAAPPDSPGDAQASAPQAGGADGAAALGQALDAVPAAPRRAIPLRLGRCRGRKAQTSRTSPRPALRCPNWTPRTRPWLACWRPWLGRSPCRHW